MKTIYRDFTIVASIPDHIDKEDCEIAINIESVSYLDENKNCIKVDVKECDIIVGEYWAEEATQEGGD